MQRGESTGHIQVLKIPNDGEAPVEIRQKWVGLILPCVMLGYQSSSNQPVFFVPQKEAIEVLEQNHPEAALWWIEHGLIREKGYFCFQEKDATMIDRVPRESITLVTDEMMGYPHR